MSLTGSSEELHRSSRFEPCTKKEFHGRFYIFDLLSDVELMLFCHDLLEQVTTRVLPDLQQACIWVKDVHEIVLSTSELYCDHNVSKGNLFKDVAS